jgi:site-specific DNA-methyltransferase (adenine-specific)
MPDGEKNIHPTVKPIALIQYLCRLVTPPGGIVLTPFNGSGTTGIASIREGFRFVGIDNNEDYIEIATNRIVQSIIDSRKVGVA